MNRIAESLETGVSRGAKWTGTSGTFWFSTLGPAREFAGKISHLFPKTGNSYNSLHVEDKPLTYGQGFAVGKYVVGLDLHEDLYKDSVRDEKREWILEGGQTASEIVPELKYPGWVGLLPKNYARMAPGHVVIAHYEESGFPPDFIAYSRTEFPGATPVKDKREIILFLEELEPGWISV